MTATDTPAAPASLGVILLVHDHLDVAARMVRHWSEGGAAIALHVDVKVPPAEVARLSRDLADVPRLHLTPRLHCEWGMFTLVQASLMAAETLLRAEAEVSHVLLASGSCLPLRPIADLRAYLGRTPDLDFIESVTAAEVGWTVGGLNEERFTLRFPFSWRRQRKLFDRSVEWQRRLGWQRKVPARLVPHLGSQWWCLTRATLEAILGDPRRGEFDRYFRHVWIPDESYFQTLARRHSTRIESRSLTLSRFDRNGRPFVFYDDHRRLLETSACFVARKVWPRAAQLLAHFPRPADGPPSLAEPQPRVVDATIEAANRRRALGRPGTYMQSRFPRKDAENGKTAAPYAACQGFADVFPAFEAWLAERIACDVHGHLFAAAEVPFADRGEVGPGCLPASPALRDHDPRGFLAQLVRSTRRPQVFQLSARDRHDLDEFMAVDPNATLHLVTGAWAVPLMHSGMPFDDVRRQAAALERVELAQLATFSSVWVKARVRRWTLGELLHHPAAILSTVLADHGAPAVASAELPPMRPVAGLGAFVQSLRNVGLQPRLIGDFPTTLGARGPSGGPA